MMQTIRQYVWQHGNKKACIAILAQRAIQCTAMGHASLSIAYIPLFWHFECIDSISP